MTSEKSQYTILAVDDTPANIDIVKGILADQYFVQAATSGIMALKVIEKQKPDVILLDIMMPEMDGYELCKLLKEKQDTKDIPIIFVSALTTAEDQIKGFEAGVDDYLPKPVNPDILLAKVLLAIENVDKNKAQAKELKYAHSTAMTAMTSLSEMGAIINYMQSLPLLHTHLDIAHRTLELIKDFGLTAIVRIEPEPDTFCFASTKGDVKPLEKELLAKLQDKGRIFSFKDASFFKNDFISLLVIKMPIDNEEFYGRLKDHFSIVINGTITAIESVTAKQKNKRLMKAEQEKNEKLKTMINTIERVLLTVEQQQSDLQKENIKNMNELVHGVEESFIYLGLNEKQEHDLIALIHKADNKGQQLFDKNSELETQITRLRTLINQ